MSYRLSSNGYVIRLADGAWIPPETGNADWRDYQAWLGVGNAPEPVPEPLAPTSVVIDGAVFLSRVTDEEYAAVIAAASRNAQLARWIEVLRMRGSIDVLGDEAQAAKTALVAAELLTQSRADAIFGT